MVASFDPVHHHPLTWHWGVDDGEVVPYLVCACGDRLPLTGRTITEDGDVATPVRHTYDGGGCGFDDYVRLEGYNPPRATGPEPSIKRYKVLKVRGSGHLIHYTDRATLPR